MTSLRYRIVPLWLIVLLNGLPLIVINAFHVRGDGISPDAQWPPSLNFQSRVTLNDGRKMPVEGFGTYRMSPGQETYNSVLLALKAGYRSIDTSEAYGNEEDIGIAVREFMNVTGISRSEIFITTKVFNHHHGKLPAMNAGRASNKRLGLGYIDLLLIHSPYGGLLVETYDGLLQLQADGVVKSVGVSNFGLGHLQALKDYCRPPPAVNQLEMHPLIWDSRKDIKQYCDDEKIIMTGYGSVLNGHEKLLNQAQAIAAKHGKTPAQIFLKWALQREIMIIPESTHKKWIQENKEVYDFHLSHDEMTTLESFSGDHLEDYWDPVHATVIVSLEPKPSSC